MAIKAVKASKANREPSAGSVPDALIDARQLAASYSVEELASKADELVRSMGESTALLAKPCSSMREAPDLLSCFGMLLWGLAPLPGMVVLDFGAGSCWTTYFLAQLGCRAIAMDVSEAMLDLGRRRFAEQPLYGECHEPSFSLFDGHRMDVADESVDRILCFDALHHVPNVGEVLSEMGRVLRPGGIAAFSEPGPSHSLDPKSQHEMRRYGVPEFDLVIEEVWARAREAGFEDVSVAVFSASPQWMSLGAFSSFMGPLAGWPSSREVTTAGPGPGSTSASSGSTDDSERDGTFAQRAVASLKVRTSGTIRRATGLWRELGHPSRARASLGFVSHVRGGLENRRMFLLRKRGTEITDSREVFGLAAEIAVEDVEVLAEGPLTTVRGTAHVRNTGANRWLPSLAGRGAVLLGLRLGRGPHPAADHARVALPGGSGVEPGESVVVPFSTQVPSPRAGEEPLRLEVDLVSEGITWFAEVRGRPYEIRLDPPS